MKHFNFFNNKKAGMSRGSLNEITHLCGLFLLFPACGVDNADVCPTYNYQNTTDYPISYDTSTASGIAVDTSGLSIDVERIEVLFQETETCLANFFGDFPSTESLSDTAGCLADTFVLPIRRECVSVKVASDFGLSCEGDWELLPYDAPPELCEAKGLKPTPDCPCRWRAAVQDQNVIITTPSFQMLKDPLIRITTSCNNPWADEALAVCAGE